MYVPLITIVMWCDCVRDVRHAGVRPALRAMAMAANSHGSSALGLPSCPADENDGQR